MSKVKVAHIATVDTTLRYVLLNQLISIRDAGYEVVAISSPGPDIAYLKGAGIEHIAVRFSRRFSPLQDLLSFFNLYKTLRRENFTIVHTHNPKPGLIGQLAARLAGVPIVINTVHGFYFHEHMSAQLRSFYIMMEKIAALNSDLILSQNREDVITAVKEGICSPNKIEFLGNGINLKSFCPASIDKSILEKKRINLGLTEDAPIVGFVGRLVAEKGILEILEAAKIVSKEIPKVKFLLIGCVDKEKADFITPSIAKDYGLEDICIFTGLRNDLPYLYSLMDVFILPSHREGFPRSPMEACAMGVPIIVTNVRGCREVVIQGHNGLQVPMLNINELVKAIIYLLKNRTKAKQIGEAGRLLAHERFDEKLVFEKVKSGYSRLLQKKLGISQ